MHVDGLGAGIVGRARDHGRQHAGHLAAGDRRRRLLLPQRDQAPGAPPRRAGRATPASPASTSSRSTGSPTPSSSAALRDGHLPTLGALDARRLAPADRLGDRLVLADRRLPGRPPARRQRRHARPSAGGRRTATPRSSPTTPDAAEIERRHSDGRGLLHEDGASRANILSGDAPHTLLTMSTVLDRNRPGRIGQDYFAYFANPYNVTRTVHAGDRRHRPGALLRRPAAPPRHPPADQAQLLLRVHARLGHGDPARPPGRRR